MNNIEISIDDKIIEFVESKAQNIKIDLKEKINKIVKFLLINENIKVSKVSVCISRETEEGIKNLNKEYRNIDKATDVLSFPIFEKEELDAIVKEEDSHKVIKELELGDIILCMEVVEKQAIEYGTGIVRETLYMITHGMCHLLGYDHIEPSDKVIMRALEKKVLIAMGVIEDGE